MYVKDGLMHRGSFHEKKNAPRSALLQHMSLLASVIFSACEKLELKQLNELAVT